MRIAVMGAGAMGTALAGIYAGKNEVSLWARRPELHEELISTRENSPYLPGYQIPEGVEIITGAVDWDRYDLAVWAIPTQHLRRVATELDASSFKGWHLNTAKGLELERFKTPCEILEGLGCDPHQVYALSGPSHAEEMCRDVPTSLVLSGMDRELPLETMEAISSPAMRPYYSRDRLGVELGGALKNIIAIACGASEGLGYGLNTTSAIITRGLSEIKRYGKHRGARPETFNGLSCLGDLVTTCCSPHSRNREFGRILVNNPMDPSAWGKLAEGATTVKSLVEECENLHFEMPLCEAIHAVVWDHRSPHDVIQSLINRPYKEED